MSPKFYKTINSRQMLINQNLFCHTNIPMQILNMQSNNALFSVCTHFYQIKFKEEHVSTISSFKVIDDWEIVVYFDSTCGHNAQFTILLILIVYQ